MIQELRIALDEGKTLLGVRTEGNIAVLLYEEEVVVRQIGFVQGYQLEEEEEDDEEFEEE